MAQIVKELLSGGTDGKNIKVAVTATAGTTIHTAHATSKDEIYVYANNTSSDLVKLTIEYGGTTDPDDLIEFSVPAEDGPYLIIPGWLLSNSLVVRAFAETANVIVINGFVNRIT